MALLNKNSDPQFRAGLWADYKSDAAPLIIDCNNLQFENGIVKPSPAVSVFAKVDTQPIVAIWSQLCFGVKTVFYQTGLDIYELRDGIVTKRFAASSSPVRFASFGNFTLLADGGQIAAKRTADGDFERIATSPPTDFLGVYSPFVLSFADRRVSWCHVDNIDLWAPAADNTARSLPIRDMDGEITSLQKAFGGFLAGSSQYQWQVSFIGAPNWFGVKQLTGIDVGAYQNQAVCQANQMVYGFGDKGFWRLDGYSYQLLDRPQMKETIFSSIGRNESLVLANDVANNRVLIIFDDKTGDRRCVFWDYTYNNFSRSDDNFVSVDLGGAYEFILFGGLDGTLYTSSSIPSVPIRHAVVGLKFKTTLSIKYGCGVAGYGNIGYGTHIVAVVPPKTSASTVVITVRRGGISTEVGGTGGVGSEVYLETRDMDFGIAEEKYIDVVIFRISQPESGDFFASFAIKDRIQDEITWSEEELILPDMPWYIRTTTRYIRIKLRNVAAAKRWQMNTIDYHGELVGGRM